PDPANDWVESSDFREVELPDTPRNEAGLSDIIIYAGAGHGFTADADDDYTADGDRGWYTQRGLTHGMVEDMGNIDQLASFVPYIFNAGATVIPRRPVGFQPRPVTVDN